jgi:hypothetical protein
MARAGLDWSTTDLAHARCGGFEDAQGCVPCQRRQAGCVRPRRRSGSPRAWDLARDQLQSSVRTKQAYPGVGVFFLATGGKVAAVIAIERSDIMVGVGAVENGALAVRQ